MDCGTLMRCIQECMLTLCSGRKHVDKVLNPFTLTVAKAAGHFSRSLSREGIVGKNILRRNTLPRFLL